MGDIRLRRSRTHMIGIAGSSCSGKSLLAKHLTKKLAHRKPVVVSTDSYYRDLSWMSEEEREKQNFDVPDAIEYELLADQLKALSEGEEIYRPIYNFSTHARETESLLIEPSDLVIVEGLFVLHWRNLRELMDTRIFVNISHDEALRRRLARDMAERGRSRRSILEQYENSVKPMTDKYVTPSSVFADIVVDGEQSMEEIASNLLDTIKLPVF